MIARIRIEYFEEKKEYKGNASVEHSFIYNPKNYKEELIEEVKKIISEYPTLISFSISI